MSIQRKILLCAALFLLFGFGLSWLLPHEANRNPNASLRIGAGDDISGYLLEQVLAELPDKSTYIQQELPSSESSVIGNSGNIPLFQDAAEAYKFQDC